MLPSTFSSARASGSLFGLTSSGETQDCVSVRPAISACSRNRERVSAENMSPVPTNTPSMTGTEMINFLAVPLDVMVEPAQNIRSVLSDVPGKVTEVMTICGTL